MPKQRIVGTMYSISLITDKVFYNIFQNLPSNFMLYNTFVAFPWVATRSRNLRTKLFLSYDYQTLAADDVTLAVIVKRRYLLLISKKKTQQQLFINRFLTL